jgi:WD40 repeat protein
MILRQRYYPLFILPVMIGLFLSSQKTTAEKSYGLWTVDISSDNKYIATGGDDSLLQVFHHDFSAFQSLKLSGEGMVRFVAWHPFDNVLAISSMKDTWIYNPETGKKIILEGKKNGSRTVAWNYTGELLASADGAGIINIWNRQGKLLRQIMKTTDGKRDSKSFLGLDWHPSKNILVTVGDEIRIYDTTGNELKMFPHREQRAGILTVKWHPSGEFFVTGDYGHPNEGIDNYLQFWKTDGSLIRTMKQSKAEFRNIRWNRQGTLLATASDALRIWDKEGNLLYTGTGNKGNLWGVDWNSNSGNIVTASYNKAGTGLIQSWTGQAKLLASYQ